MSNKNYDVELPITYDPTYKHYIPIYTVRAPYFQSWSKYGGGTYYCCEYYVSFDDGSETKMAYTNVNSNGWAKDCYLEYITYVQPTPDTWQSGNANVPDSGVFNKVYFRNPWRNKTSFSTSNCGVLVMYSSKASFEVQWNSTGFAANSNAWFKCSTVQKNTYGQYEWTAATVYYKASTDQNYTSVAGTVSGSWSDVTINTNISLTDGVTYDIYITATADDGSTASTPVAQFTTTDSSAVATCISPSGAFTKGDVTFIWSHSTAYGTPQYAYDLQYSANNGGTWTTLASHVVTQNTTDSTTLTDAGVYLWRVRTYNSNDVVGEWAEATFVNQGPASPPTNLMVNTKGRPTVSWASVSQSAYQVQFLQSDTVVYDSGAIYTSETSHFVNQYFNDTRSYTVRVRIYNALGEISDWTETGYQQPSVTDVQFTIEGTNGVIITVTPDDEFVKYYLLRNNKLIAEITDNSYTDKYSIGQVSYSVVGVTSNDQSDIQSVGYRAIYDHATLTALNGQQFLINERVDNAYQIQTSNEADVNTAKYMGDGFPTHYPSKMRLKSFTVTCFDGQGIMEDLLGTLVYYADNFGNGGWCIVTNYSKTDNFIKNSSGAYANEVSLTLEVTNYDDSIEYPI